MPSLGRLPDRLLALGRQAFGAGGPLVLGRVASAVVTFALPLLLVRLLRPEAFGTYKQFFLVGQTALLVGQLGLTQSLYYFLPREGARRGAFLSSAIIMLTCAGVIAGGVLYLAGPLLQRHFGGGSIGELALPLGVFAGSMLAASPLEGSLLSERRIGQAALTYLLSDVLRALSLVGAAFFVGGHALYWAAASLGLVRLGALWLLVGRKVLPTAPIDAHVIRRQLAYSLPFAGAALLQVAQRTFAQYAVSTGFDAATFALYAVASFHLPVVDIVYTPLADVLTVSISGARTQPEAARVFTDTVRRLAQILFPATLCAWLFGPSLLPLLFTSRYLAAVPLFFFTTCEIPFWIYPCDALLRALGQTRFLFWWNGIRLALAATLVLGGIHFLGLRGAIIGGVIAEALSRLGVLSRGAKGLSTSVVELADYRGLLPIVARALLSAVPVVGVKLLHLRPSAFLVIGIGLYALCYLTLSVRLKRLPLPMITPGAVAR